MVVTTGTTIGTRVNLPPAVRGVEGREGGCAAVEPLVSSGKLWLRHLRRRVDQESSGAVAGVAGLEAGRLAVSRGRAEKLLAVAPVLRRGGARAGGPAAGAGAP